MRLPSCAPSTTNASTFIIIFVVIAVGEFYRQFPTFSSSSFSLLNPRMHPVVFALSSIVALVRYRRINQFQHDLVQHATFEASTIPTPYAIPESMHHAHHHHAHHHAHIGMNMQNTTGMMGGGGGGGGGAMAGY